MKPARRRSMRSRAFGYVSGAAVLVSLSGAGCRSTGGSPGAEPSSTAATPSAAMPSAVPPSTPPPSAAPTPPTEACTAASSASVSIAMRPHSKEVFGQLDPGNAVIVTARSKDGWLGFDPAVAQAANVGPFRLRWLDPNDVAAQGNCESIPEVWTPEPGLCFEMPQADVAVKETADAKAKDVATLHAGEFAAITGRAAKGWVKVDLSKGNTPSKVSGYITEGAVNMNGPCDALAPH